MNIRAAPSMLSTSLSIMRAVLPDMGSMADDTKNRFASGIRPSLPEGDQDPTRP